MCCGYIRAVTIAAGFPVRIRPSLTKLAQNFLAKPDDQPMTGPAISLADDLGHRVRPSLRVLVTLKAISCPAALQVSSPAHPECKLS